MAASPEPVESIIDSANTYRNGRTIFRPEALRHYRESQNRIEFPRLAAPRVLVFLWILATTFILLGVAVGSRVVIPIG